MIIYIYIYICIIVYMYVLLLFGEVIVGNMVESPSVGRETEQLRGLIKDLLVNSSQLSASRILDLL